MPAVLLAGITVALVVYLLFGPVRNGFAVLVAATFLIPGAMRPPGIHSAHLGTHRVLLLAFGINLFFKVRRGKLPVDAFRPGSVHLALLGYAVLSFVIGVAIGDAGVPITHSIYAWLFVVDQLVIFTAAVAIMRTTDDLAWVVKLYATVAVIIAGIAVVEHFRHWSYERWLFRKLPAQAGAPGNYGLELRSGDVRVRAGADFSLAYAWIATGLFPFAMVAAAHARRRVAIIFPGLVGLSILWTYTRSAYIGVLIVVAVLLMASRLAKNVTAVAAAGVLVALVLLSASPALTRAFRGQEASGSNKAREQRLPVVLRDAADRPLTGVGIASLSFSQGIATTDASYLATYAEVGVIGLSGLLLVFGILVWRFVPALRAPPGKERTMAAAALAGLVAGVIAAASYDEFSVSQGFRLFWLIAALGVVLSERAPAHVTAHRLPIRVILPVAGAALGVLIFISTPTFGAVTLRFNSSNAGIDFAIEPSIDFTGQALTNSMCSVMTSVARQFAGTVATCYDLRTRAGLGEIRIQASDEGQATREAATMLETAKKVVPWATSYVVESVNKAKPTWARTAPVWMAVTGVGLSFFVPPIPFHRRKLTPPPGWRLVRAT